MADFNKKERRRPVVVSLKQKLNSMPKQDRKEFAERCGTSFGNLLQIAYGWGGCSISLAQSIVAACDKSVELDDLIPELKKSAS
tara:strand:- start:10523 stop:10774 length:252 start_codon:yes stop_codon:yes gene_type:complete